MPTLRARPVVLWLARRAGVGRGSRQRLYDQIGRRESIGDDRPPRAGTPMTAAMREVDPPMLEARNALRAARGDPPQTGAELRALTAPPPTPTARRVRGSSSAHGAAPPAAGPLDVEEETERRLREL